MQRLRVRQVEPPLGLEVAPVEPMTLASASQGVNPLPLYFMQDPSELALAVVEPEVLIEAAQHHRQMTLLLTAFPVHVPLEPVVGASQKFPAALHARDSDHCELAAPIHPANVFEAKKLERLRLLTELRAPIGGETAKEHEPSLLLGHFQVELRKARLQLSLEALCVSLVLEAHHKIVSEPDEVGLSLALRLEPLLEPQIENKVQVDISQQRAERPALWSSLFASRDNPILHHACIEPLTNQTQDDRIGDAVGNHPAQPGMIYVVEVSSDVGFEDLAHLLGHDLHA